MKINKIVIVVLATVVLSGLFLTSLWMRSLKKESGENKPTIEQVKKQHESELMAVRGVLGVGISECKGRPCIRVYLANESPNLKKQIPNRLDGFKVDIQLTDNFEALTAECGHRQAMPCEGREPVTQP